jgi:RHS repeat-associated protein
VQKSLHSFFEPDVLTATDYYPFGMEMPGRKYNPQGYRYGFNGKENDRSGEWGLGLVQDYGARIYSPGLGRWLSTDPLEAKYPMYSPYVGMGDNPMVFIDADGKEIIIAGSPEFKAKAFEALQALTNDKLIMLESGKVILATTQTKNDVVALTGNPIDKASMDFKHGTELVSTLIKHEKTVSIRSGEVNNSVPENFDAANRDQDRKGKIKGTNSTIHFNPEYCGESIPNADSRYEGDGRPTFIALGHEGLHSLAQMNGNVNPTFYALTSNGARGIFRADEIDARNGEQLLRDEHKLSRRVLEKIIGVACAQKSLYHLMKSYRECREKYGQDACLEKKPTMEDLPQENKQIKCDE